MKKINFLILGFGMFVLSSCIQIPKEAFRDVEYERYLTYKKELQESVNNGRLTSEQAFKLDQEAYDKYVENRNRRDEQRLIQSTTDAIKNTISDYQSEKTSREFFKQ